MNRNVNEFSLSNGFAVNGYTIYNSLLEEYTFISKNELERNFHLTIASAAQQMSVKKIDLTNLCKTIGIGRWPFRSVQAINDRIQQLRASFLEPSTTPIEILNFIEELEGLKKVENILKIDLSQIVMKVQILNNQFNLSKVSKTNITDSELSIVSPQKVETSKKASTTFGLEQLLNPQITTEEWKAPIEKFDLKFPHREVIDLIQNSPEYVPDPLAFNIKLNQVNNELNFFKTINKKLLNVNLAQRIQKLENLIMNSYELNETIIDKFINETKNFIHTLFLYESQNLKNKSLQDFTHIVSPIQNSTALISSIAGSIISNSELTTFCKVTPLINFPSY